MSQLVRIAPGVVFSSDMLGAEWVRKVLEDDAAASLCEDTQTTVRRGRPVKESDQAIHEGISIQMSLL
jgi:hypothetical protein